MSARQTALGWAERIGYGGGDFGFNLYWVTIASFLAAFYTDYFGISAAAAATMLLVTKIVDAVTDPIMGAVADRTRTRFGKFRPYLLFGGVPLAAAGVLAFTTPDLTPGLKLAWAYATYTLLMMCYTMVNTPYSALSGVLTANSQERTLLISIRFIFAYGGGTLVSKYTLPLVEHFGQGEPVRGWQATMLLYGVIAVLVFWCSFAATRERIQPIAATATRPQRDIADLMKSQPWLILFALSMIIMLLITMRTGSAFYFFKYYLERPELLSNYLASQTVALAVGAALTPVLTRYIDKAKLLIVLMTVVAALSVVYYFIPRDAIATIFVVNTLISLSLGPKAPLTWSMYADTADYNEWKTGRRATAMTFAAATFSQKIGSAIGTAGMLWCLALIGYVANEAQTGASQTGIALMQTLAPGAFALLAVLAASFYGLSGAELGNVQRELAERDAG
ncbi:MAG: MFS transporter [Pseudomonadota bacterium]